MSNSDAIYMYGVISCGVMLIYGVLVAIIRKLQNRPIGEFCGGMIAIGAMGFLYSLLWLATS